MPRRGSSIQRVDPQVLVICGFRLYGMALQGLRLCDHHNRSRLGDNNEARRGSQTYATWALVCRTRTSVSAQFQQRRPCCAKRRENSADKTEKQGQLDTCQNLRGADTEVEYNLSEAAAQCGCGEPIEE